MPWCDTCDRFWNPNTVHDDGSCPDCGSQIARPSKLQKARRGRGSSADAMAVRASQQRSDSPEADDAANPGGPGEDEAPGTPWHFKVLLVALIIYLGWRLIQGILWVSHKL